VPRRRIMQINGYDLRAAIKKLTRKKDILQAKFVKNTTYFASKGEKPDLEAISGDLNMVETQLVALQVAQLKYNLSVQATVKGYEPMSLAAAVKQAGTRIRMATTWRKVAGEKPERHSYRDETLQTGVEYIQQAVTTEEALRIETRFNDEHALFQKAIAEANAKSVSIDVPKELEKLVQGTDG
jgi:hypothetical protein